MDTTFGAGPSLGGRFDRASSPMQSQNVDDERHLDTLLKLGLSDEQSRELHAVLDTIARGFVEYGWSGEVCGQLLDGFQAVLSNAVKPLVSTDPNQEERGDEHP